MNATALLFASNLRHQMQQNAKTKRFLSIKKAATCFVTAFFIIGGAYRTYYLN